MKQIINYIIQHNKDINKKFYIFIICFLSVCIIINYKIDFENKYLDKSLGTNLSYLYHFLFFSFAYYTTAIAIFIFNNKTHYLKKTSFWVMSALFIFIISLSSGYYNYSFLNLFNSKEKYFIYKILVNLKRFVLFLIPLLIIHFAFYKKEKSFYGLTLHKFNIKPYFIMLLFVLPLIIAASFFPSFTKVYPTFKSWLVAGIFNLETWQTQLIYEFFYGIDFIFVELIFRGALVIGMVKIIGKEAIIPMAVCYCFFHFGKPVGEAISSAFGGYILGVIAYYYRSILGGCIIHIGVAYSMEFCAFLQRIKLIDLFNNETKTIFF